MSRLKKIKQLRNVTSRLEQLDSECRSQHQARSAGLLIESDNGIRKRVEFDSGKRRKIFSSPLTPDVTEQNAKFDLWLKALAVPEFRDQFEAAVDSIVGRASHSIEAARRVATARNSDTSEIKKLIDRYQDNPLFEDELLRQRSHIELKDKRDSLCEELDIKTENPSGGEPEYPDDSTLRDYIKAASRRTRQTREPN